MPINIFFCYAREDEALLKKLKAHLRPFQRQGLINLWYDRDIGAGTDWEQEIKERLNAAQVVLLLVSPDFMNSDYCYSIEMQQALERHARGEAKVIPIILRPVYWHGEPLGKLQALPTDGKPVTGSDWHNPDSALYDVTDGIYKVVMQMISPHVLSSKAVTDEKHKEVAKPNVIKSALPQEGNISTVYTPLAVEKLAVFLTLTGHSGAVRSVAINPDGQTLVSGSDDYTIKVWNLSISKGPRTLTGHSASVRSVAISPDGQTLVSGSKDGTIKVWNLSTGEELRTLTGHSASVRSVAISPDGQTLVTGSDKHPIKVWNLSTGEELRTLISSHLWRVYSVAISPDGQTLVSGGMGGISVWNLFTGTELRTIGKQALARSVAISPSGQTLVSGSWGERIKVRNLSTGKKLHTLTGPPLDDVQSVAISPDGQTLISGSGNGIKIWNLSTGEELRTLTGHSDTVNSVAISPDGQTLVSGSKDGTIKVWRA